MPTNYLQLGVDIDYANFDQLTCSDFKHNMQKQTNLLRYLTKNAPPIVNKPVPSILHRPKDPNSRQNSDAQTQKLQDDDQFNDKLPYVPTKQYCSLFYLINPEHLTSYNSIRSQLESLAGELNPKRRVLELIRRQIKTALNIANAESINLKNLEDIISSVFWEHALPTIIKRVVKGNLKPFKLLVANNSANVTLTKGDVLAILTHMFLCTMPQQYLKQQTTFAHLYNGSGNKSSVRLEKLKCIISYFQAMSQCPESQMRQNIIFQRVFRKDRKYMQQPKPLSNIYVTHKLIEQHKRQLMVDFANKHIGGGVLKNGCVQEEILFVTHPQLLVSTLLYEQLNENECARIHGCLQYANYDGYSGSFKYKSRHKQNKQLDVYDKQYNTFVVIDAVNFNEGMYKSVKDSQYQETIVNKELHKAYMGFSDGEFLDESLGRRQVATGKWGCGAFGGDPELKLIIQWLACSWAERDMIYVNWGEEDQSSNTVSLHEIIQCLKDLKTTEVRAILKKYSEFRKQTNIDIKLSDYLCDFYFL